MLKQCVKAVQNLCTNLVQTPGLSQPIAPELFGDSNLRLFVPNLRGAYSHAARACAQPFLASSNLLNPTFYPLSTAPTNTTNLYKENSISDCLLNLKSTINHQEGS